MWKDFVGAKMKRIKCLKVEWLFTRRCNLRCNYCKIVKNPDLECQETNTEEAKRIVSIIADNWPGAPIVFFGGEPTVRDDLPDVIAKAVEKKVKPIVISNSVRVLKDEDYTKRLVDSGLDNWSISYDGPNKLLPDNSVRVKSTSGLNAIRMFRDKYGFRDLVACITVSRQNIDALPKIVEFLTKEGVWSICTPLQIGGVGYDYSCGYPRDLPTQEQVDESANVLMSMSASGNYLMHNRPVWFESWPNYFIEQTWKCHDKSILTLDADGYLRQCVDRKLRDPVHIFSLENDLGVEKYLAAIKKGPLGGCLGCFWDPAFESILRGLDPKMSDDDGRLSYRHELSEEQIAALLPAARKYFQEKK
jgi:MoaA/NifB/PqqE/SkfB family radical SAM enzyme